MSALETSFLGRSLLLTGLTTLGLAFTTSATLATCDVYEGRVLEETGSGANWVLTGGEFRGSHYSPVPFRTITYYSVRTVRYF